MNGYKMSMKKTFAYFFVFLIIIVSTIMIYKSNVNAATISSNIDGIDETKYPGYKDRIKQLQKIYPNIKVMYTGLDWNTVIREERVHSRNLVPKDYTDEWICPECGKTSYDTGWYCASDDAVKYLMDPRVYLDQQNIFQFQRLDTSAGTLDSKKIKLAAYNSFLSQDENIVALYNAAHDNNINAVHLVVRTIQEQGWDGTSTLSSGRKYTGIDGVTYEGLYNLFSIGATGSTTAEVKTNGLARALSEGWTSRPLSIAGGGTFIKNKYLNRKQNTLYLQKFDVDASYDGLYWHQYMQNLFGAKNEASLMYDAYNRAGLLLSSDFEFIVPIYENMPVNVSKKPSPEYYGEINTDLKTLNLDTNFNSIKGEILIAEWINGVAYTPKSTPKITIKSTDGHKIVTASLKHNGGLSYAYSIPLNDFDVTKEYEIIADLTTENNISNKKSMKVKISDRDVGRYNNLTIKIKNNKMYFSNGNYVGEINTDLKEIQLNKNTSGKYYFSGNILIAEWINSVANVPKTLPELKLKSTDGTENIDMYISHIEGLNYYYDVFVDNLNISKQYYIEARLTTEDNISTKKTQTVKLPNKEFGKVKEMTLISNDNLIKPTYNGEINTDLKTLTLETSSNRIKGEILIAEWINSVANTPAGLPEITLKSTDGATNKKLQVSHKAGLEYNFNINLDDLEINKEYYIEAKLTGVNNIGNKKTQNVKITNGTIGQTGIIKVISVDNKIKKIDTSLYYGEINTDLQIMKIAKNGSGLEYMYGNIIIAEWVEGNACQPKGLPEMTLKSTDGTYSAGMYVRHESGLTYYYDRVIYNLDTSKEYYIEVKLTGNKNISNKKIQNANLNVMGTIGQLKEKNAVVKNNKITFKGNEYYGEINTDLQTMKIAKNGSGLEYMYGNIIIAEWVDGIACQPKGLPTMTLKSTDGTYSAGMYVRHEGGLTYYYDRVIYNLDTNKEYYIEVKLTGQNNISNKKTQNANINAKGTIGQLKGKNAVVKNNKITFKGNEYYGEINTDLQIMKLGKNSSGQKYLYGNIIIAEWINGNACQPNGLPTMTLKSTDGTYSAEMYVQHQSGLMYYYDIFITNIDTNKEYYIEVKLTGRDNISNKKTQNANLNEKDAIGMFNESIKVEINNNKIVFRNIGINASNVGAKLLTSPIQKNEMEQVDENKEVIIEEKTLEKNNDVDIDNEQNEKIDVQETIITDKKEMEEK